MTTTEPVVALLDDVWRDLAALGEPLTDAEWRTPTELPGWTVKDNLAHVVGTEKMLLGDDPPDVEAHELAGAHVRNPIGEFNERWVATYRSASGPEVLAALKEVTASRLAALNAMTPADFDRVGFTPEGEGPYRRFMEIRVFDCWMHSQDMRVALDQPGGMDGPVAQQSVARLHRAMPYVIGKKAQAPEGSTVVFDIAGPVGARLGIEVSGRANLVDRELDDPTVRLVMDTLTYVRLAGGRLDGAAAIESGAVTIDGDQKLGRRILASMGFTL